jgi:hypothetical protein
MLALKLVTKSVVLTGSQNAVQRHIIRAHWIQHWYSRDKHFQYVMLLTNHVHKCILWMLVYGTCIT